ncbi:uncharacterized protein LOC122378929 [Amphibalanus amphitrite]|uniref:uncharacterized protein LOC122378929 n=1 Tax=Amphibalanus amphitrite TaxID=1232801 RepID=UPI001C928AA3|nr:uncharacterized protein LOC122378929 [Amphibalanus amphitrite]XP_043216560.1 uncharacterized protein LOC122378929 [Amphibalanus amphitrite]XP_043216570.1 uncharacterized protein LOC122378929 [Amphibalanus amphitrite]XP_043216580.1 uncharacterized protein LOC122378929 [Amphibalanus amphitrite]
MPSCLGVPTLQDVCLQQFCRLLSELAISSPKILAEQAPQQESSVTAGCGTSTTAISQKAGQQTVQNEADQAVPSEDTEDAVKLLEDAAETEEMKSENRSSETTASENEVATAGPEDTHEKANAAAVDPGTSLKQSVADEQNTSGHSLRKADSFQEQQKEARSYLIYNVPPCFFEQLVHRTLTQINKHFYDPKYKSRRPAMVAVTCWLLGDHIRHLSLDQCRMLCDRAAVAHVFRCLAHMPRLQTLAIGRLNFWKIPELSLLPDLLSGLPQLTTLRLEYICLPEMLVGLDEKCPQLQELSLKDSEKVTDREVAQIRRCLLLRRLNISGTSITGAGSWQILCSLPSLTWFEHCPFNCNSGPFLFDSREAMLSYIWEFLSPEGRAHSAQLPSVTGEMALPASRGRGRAPEGGAEGSRGGAPRDGAANSQERAPTVGAANDQDNAPSADTVNGQDSASVASAADDDASVPPDGQDSAPADGPEDAGQQRPESGAAANPVPSRESSIGADGSAASASGRHVSPLPLSRSGSGSGCGSPRRLRIENFWLFNPKTEEVALSRLCPVVSLLKLDFVFQDMGRSPDLAGLAHLKHVTRLEINSFDAPRFSVMSEVLRQLGGQLTELALHVCDDYTATAALENAVARWCPRLERYSFTGDYSVRLPAERGDDELQFGELHRRHTQLRELTLGGFVTGRRLLFVLAHADGLRRLKLDGELRYLDDTGFNQLLAANRLHQLEELWINCSAALTVQPLLPLMFDSQSALCRLGRLSSLQGLDRAGFIELRRQVRSLNLALELVWVTPGV